MLSLVYIIAWEDSLRFLDTSYTCCAGFIPPYHGYPDAPKPPPTPASPAPYRLYAAACRPDCQHRGRWAVNGQSACQKDPYEPHPALTVDVRCPKVGEEFTITVSNSTVEHPYYTITLDEAIFLARLTYDGQITLGEEIASFEILSTQASEWEMSITLKALEEGEFTFGISATGLVGGMWTGDGYGSVLISVGK